MIIFIHIPRTGGTTLTDWFDEHPDFWTMRGPRTKPISRILPQAMRMRRRDKEKGNRRFRVLHGHMHWDKPVSRRHKIITMLRDPIERYLSTLFYQHMQFFRREWWTPEAKKEALEALNGIQRRIRFKWYAKPDLMTKMLGNGDLNTAISNLERFSFVGITEQYTTSIRRLFETFGWPLDTVLFEKTNRSHKLNTMSLPPILIEHAKRANRRDIELYREARRMFGYA